MIQNKKDKYLLLYLKTGGGHLAPAKSVAARLQKDYTHIEPVLIDGFEKASFLIKGVVEGGYRQSQSIATWVYEMLYAIHKVKFIAKFIAWIISLFVRPYLKDLISRENPKKIIIFHFFLIDPVYNVLSKLNLDVKTYTVVTDPFTAHPLWFLQKEQNFILFSDQLKEKCVFNGIPESSLRVFPFILNEKFSRTLTEMEKIELKEYYSIDSKRNVLLILGGGDGIPKGERILEMLLRNIPDSEIIIVCGKNKNLFHKASQLKESFGAEFLHIFGYVDFVYELINISDVVVTKCGASTSMEILFTKKIPVITDYIWEQEKGNKDYIVKNGMGIYVRHLKSLPDAVKVVLTNKSYYRKNIERAALRNGTEEVVRYIAS